MITRARVAVLAAALVVLAVLVAACGSSSSGHGHPTTSSGQLPTTAGGSAGSGKYLAAIDAAASRHVRVWLEADLVKRWQQGPTSLAEAVAKLHVLGSQPGVVGVKIADELGQQDGLDSQNQVLAFLDGVVPAVRKALPGKKILIDMVVPELGCVPGVPAQAAASDQCREDARAHWPGATLAIASAVVDSGLIDVLDLSTGLLNDADYAAMGLSRDDAQRAAWAEVAHLGWGRHVTLQARKALAHDGGYAGDDAQASADLRTWVDIPLASGAKAVDVWTWRQSYHGGIAMIMSRGLGTNALWQGLLDHNADRDRLITHFSPSSTEIGLAQDLDRLAEVFGNVFIAAGTG